MKKKLKLVVPKGRIFENINRLLREVGIDIAYNGRFYTPHTGEEELEIKIMKPQNIAQLVELGSHDIGFTGYDWIVESRVRVMELMDLMLDPVKIVAAIPDSRTVAELKSRRFVVASEYENICRDFLTANRYEYLFIRTFGATEAFPPDDADMIVDNSSTGRTLEAHGLKVIHELLSSSTRFIANPAAMEDDWKRERIGELCLLFQAVLNARTRVMLEMNVPPDKLAEVVSILPCMRAPTVSPLFQDQGYAVKVAVQKCEIRCLIPRLKRMGASDILEYSFKKVIP